MKGHQIIISGNWAHFRKADTNNNPLTHDFITKTALIGLIGAVIGIERKDMKKRFPELSDDILYGVQLLKHVKKVSWSFTSKKAVNPTGEGSPKAFEFLQNPSFKISLALRDKRSETLFDEFINFIKNSEAVYPPVLGWHNCPAELEWSNSGTFLLCEDSTFETMGFVEADKHIIQSFETDLRIGFERVPTFQNNDWWNLPERYKKIIYPECSSGLKIKGDSYCYDMENGTNESWWLI